LLEIDLPERVVEIVEKTLFFSLKTVGLIAASFLWNLTPFRYNFFLFEISPMQAPFGVTWNFQDTYAQFGYACS
jgi:hypothetical protein